MNAAAQFGTQQIVRMPYRRRRDRRLRGVSSPLAPRPSYLSLQPDSYFLDLVWPPAQQAAMKKYWSDTQSYVNQALTSGRLPAYTEERCANIKPVDKKTLVTSLVAQTAGGVASVASAAGAAAGAVIPGISVVSSTGVVTGSAVTGATGVTAVLAAAAPFLLVGAVVFGVISAIFAHHAKAVALEQTTLCGAIPGANEALAWVDAEFKAGRISKADAATALDELLRNFDKYVQPILKDSGNGKVCNYACGARRALTALIAKKKAEYAEAPEATLAAIIGGGDVASLLPWAAAAAVVFMAMR